MKRNEILLALASFLLPFYIYCYTLCPTVSVYADAAEYPTFAFINGFGHPPGYPLFILILKIFLLLPFGNPAYKANLASAFIASLTCFLFYKLIKLLTSDRYISLSSSLILAFSGFFWKSAVVSEVFSLLALFIILTLYLFLRWQKTGKIKYFYWFILACGFGLAHHQTLLFTLFPLFIWFLLNRNWKKLTIKDYFFGFILLIIGFLPYLYIWWVAKNWPLMNWENPQNLRNLVRLITRTTYGSFRLTVSPAVINPFTQLRILAEMYLGSFTILGIILVLIGSIKAFMENKKIFFCSLFVIVAVLLVFGIFSGISLSSPAEIQVLERFQVIAGIFVVILIAYGLTFLKKFGICLFFFPLFIFVFNLSSNNQRNNYFGENLAYDYLKDLPSNSLLVLSTDATINTVFYARYVLKKRPDVAYLVEGLLTCPPEWYVKELKNFYPDIILTDDCSHPNESLSEMLYLNFPHKNLFLDTAGITPETETPFYKKIKGIVSQYYPYDPKINSDEEARVLDSLAEARNLKFLKKFPKNSAEESLFYLYGDPYVYLGDLNSFNFKESENYYLTALKITPWQTSIRLKLAALYAQNKEFSLGVSTLRQVLKTTKDPQLIKDIKTDIKTYEDAKNKN